MSGTDYFTYVSLQANTLARASDVNARMASIQGGFAKLPVPEKIREDRVTAVIDEGSTNFLVVSLDTAPSAYNFGLELTVKIANTNTGAATVNVNGLGAKVIQRADGSTLSAGDLVAGAVVKLIFDGTAFRLLGASESALAAAVTSAAAYATNAATSATASAASALAASISEAAAAVSAANAAASAAAAATAATGYLPLSGGTMLGTLILAGVPTANLHAATKKYVDDAVFAAGAYTADGATITLSTGQFSLTAIADQRVLGNVSGGSAKPTALTGAQLAAFLPTFSSIAAGLCPLTGGVGGAFLRSDATWQQITTISGNAGTATKLATARTIAISGAVTGTATGFDGSANITIPITALDVGAATTGVLAVARGGTGVQTSTGTGNNVLSDSPTFTGTITAAAINASGNIFGHDIFASRGDGTGVIYLNNAFTRYLFYDGTNYLLPGAGVSIVSPPAGSAGSLAVHAGWVQNELASYAKAKLVITPLSIDRTLANADNNSLLQLTGAVARTLTAGNIDTGVSIIIANTGTATWAFSCPGGVYLDGSSTTTTSANILAGGRGTAVHLGGGVWLLSGV